MVWMDLGVWRALVFVVVGWKWLLACGAGLGGVFGVGVPGIGISDVGMTDR